MAAAVLLRPFIAVSVALLGAVGCGTVGEAPPPTAEYRDAYDRAARLEREGHSVEAAGVYGEAAEIAARPRFRWQAEYRQARELEKGGRRAEALRMYLAIAEEDPEGEMAPRCIYYAARMAHEDGEHQVALRRLRHVIETYPDNGMAPQAIRRAVQWLDDRGQIDRAVELLTELEARLRGTDVGDNLLWHLGLIAEERGQGEAALAYWERQTELYVFPRSSLWDDALWRAGRLAAALGQHERAIGYLESLVSRREDSVGFPASYYTEHTDDAQLLIGRIYLDHLDDPRSAARELEELSTFPDSTLADDGLWWASRAYLELGQARRSCATLRRLLGRFPYSNMRRRARAAMEPEGCE